MIDTDDPTLHDVNPHFTYVLQIFVTFSEIDNTAAKKVRGGPTCVHESLQVQCIDVQAKCTHVEGQRRYNM